MSIQTFQKGTTIYSAGDLCSEAFIVVSGSVNLISPNGAVRNVLAGEMIGEMSLLQEIAYQETAVATESVTLQALSENKVESLVKECPLEIQKIFHAIANRPAETVTASASNNAEVVFDQGVVKVTTLLEERINQLQRQITDFDEMSGQSEDADHAEIHAVTSDVMARLPEMAPIFDLLDDETINDILINGPKCVFVERSGMLEMTDVQFPSDAAVLKLANSIVNLVGRKMDRKRPLIDARLLDGSRVNIIAPPLAVDGTTISIRKFSKRRITLDVMKQSGNVSESLAEFLKVIGHCRLNTVISGGTGSGKTTLLNAISQHIDTNERIVTIEDAAELKLNQPHVVRLETRPATAGIRKNEEVSMRDLVKNALRMRPDRIIVGEVRGAEAFDMMQAMNTGHEGSLTTIHANHPRDALSRLENMVSMANLQIPMKSLRYQIASALHLIVQISRMRDGQRRVTHISEVVGMEGEMITMHDLFTYNIDGEDSQGKIVGHFKWSGIMPRFIRRVQYYGEQERLEKALGIKLTK